MKIAKEIARIISKKFFRVSDVPIPPSENQRNGIPRDTKMNLPDDECDEMLDEEDE